MADTNQEEKSRIFFRRTTILGKNYITNNNSDLLNGTSWGNRRAQRPLVSHALESFEMMSEDELACYMSKIGKVLSE
jgi:hypothetical protein